MSGPVIGGIASVGLGIGVIALHRTVGSVMAFGVHAALLAGRGARIDLERLADLWWDARHPDEPTVSLPAQRAVASGLPLAVVAYAFAPALLAALALGEIPDLARGLGLHVGGVSLAGVAGAGTAWVGLVGSKALGQYLNHWIRPTVALDGSGGLIVQPFWATWRGDPGGAGLLARDLSVLVLVGGGVVCGTPGLLAVLPEVVPGEDLPAAETAVMRAVVGSGLLALLSIARVAGVPMVRRVQNALQDGRLTLFLRRHEAPVDGEWYLALRAGRPDGLVVGLDSAPATAARMSPLAVWADTRRWGWASIDVVRVRCGSGARYDGHAVSDEWRDVVRHLMRGAGTIVFGPDPTPGEGLRWEREVAERDHADRVVLIVPPEGRTETWLTLRNAALVGVALLPLVDSGGLLGRLPRSHWIAALGVWFGGILLFARAESGHRAPPPNARAPARTPMRALAAGMGCSPLVALGAGTALCLYLWVAWPGP